MTNALLKTPLRQVASVKELLMNQGARDQLAMVASKHMNPERMMRVVANSIRTTPKLAGVEPMSMLGAIMQCAALNLEPNTVLAHAYILPFDNRRKDASGKWNTISEAQVVIGYKGFIELARRSGKLAGIHSDVVYDDDEVWSHEYGSNQHLKHVPGPRNGKLLGAYCFVKVRVGDDLFAEGHRFLTIAEIIKHRDAHSKGWQSAVRLGKTADSPWNPDGPAFEAMCMKTAVRAMANRGELPMSVEFMDALQVDESKADFRAFAMDPTAGVTVDGEVESDSEPEAEQEQAKPAALEQAQATAQTASTSALSANTTAHVTELGEVVDTKPIVEEKPKPKQEAAKVEPVKQTAPALVDDSAPDEPSQLERTADMIIKDLTDGGTAEEIGELYGEPLNRIEVELPAQYRIITDLMNKSRR